MADVTYRIVTELDSKGSISGNLSEGKLEAMDRSVSKISSSTHGIASSLNQAFTGAVEKIASAGLHLAKIGLELTGIGGMVGMGAMTKLASDLEQLQMGLASIFGANGVAKDMEEGMRMSAELIKKMREDSAALPVSFKDVADMMKTIATTGFRSGASVGDLEKMSLSASTFASIEGISNKVASRELATLLAGHATSQNVIALRLGIHGGKEFKEMDPHKRFQMIEEAMGAYTSKATSTFSGSFKALATTLKNNLEFGAILPAFSPLFERIKQSMKDANDWFSQNQDKVTRIAQMVGNELVYIWNVGIEKVKEFGPLLLDYAVGFKNIIIGVFEEIKPVIEYLRTHVDARDIKTTGEVYGISKIASGFGGGGMLTGAFEGLAAAVGGAGEAFVILAGVAIGLVGIYDMLTDAENVNHQAAVDSVKDISEQADLGMANLKQAWTDFQPVWQALETVIGGALLGSVELLAHAFSNLTFVVQELAKGMGWIVTHFNAEMGYMYDDPKLKIDRDFQAPPAPAVIAGTAAVVTDYMARTSNLKNLKGGGGTHINKIEINVQQTGDPQRVARAVMDKLADVQRYKRNSPWVPNFSSSR